MECIAVRQVAINEYHKIPEIINGFVEEIIELGPNPFKGFWAFIPMILVAIATVKH